MLYMLKANKYFGVIKFILGGYNYMRFDNEELFKELVKKYGMNLFVGAGFLFMLIMRIKKVYR